MSIHWYSFRQGDRSEYLALYMLSALGLAVKVPREEDVGIDFHCTLARQEGQKITYYSPYNVQVKSSTVDELKYGGNDDNKRWREHQVRWLLNQTTPFFVAIVDKAKGQMDLFSTATRWFAVHNSRLPFLIKFKPYMPDNDHHLGNGDKTGLSNIQLPSYAECVSWEIPIGQPILSINFDKAEDKDFVAQARTCLHGYVSLDEKNAVAAATGLKHFQWPLVVRTNQVLAQIGISVGWSLTPSQDTHNQLRALAPIVATLLRTFEGAGDADKVQRLGMLLDLIPQDGDLTLVRKIIEDGIQMQATKAV